MSERSSQKKTALGTKLAARIESRNKDHQLPRPQQTIFFFYQKQGSCSFGLKQGRNGKTKERKKVFCLSVRFILLRLNLTSFESHLLTASGILLIMTLNLAEYDVLVFDIGKIEVIVVY